MNPISSDQITEAKNTAQSAGQRAIEFGAQSNTLADELRKAIGERYNTSNEAKIGATARSNFLQAAPQARADVMGLINSGNILSPTQQSSILASKRAAALVPVMAANTMDSAAFGTMGDLISAGSNVFNREATRQSGLAQLAQNSYSDLLNNFYKQLGESRQQTAEKRLAEMQPLEIAYKQAQINASNRSNPGGGGTATERLTAEKKQLIQEASKLPEATRKAYILANGYNPNATDFSGLFSNPAGLNINTAGALEKTGQIDKYTVDPNSGRLIPKPQTTKDWWNPFTWFQ